MNGCLSSEYDHQPTRPCAPHSSWSWLAGGSAPAWLEEEALHVSAQLWLNIFRRQAGQLHRLQLEYRLTIQIYLWAGGIDSTLQIFFASVNVELCVCACVCGVWFVWSISKPTDRRVRLISLCDEQRVFIIKFIVIIAIDHCYYYNSLPGISVNICYYAGKKKIKETLEKAYWNCCLLSQPVTFLGLLRTYCEMWWMTDELNI